MPTNLNGNQDGSKRNSAWSMEETEKEKETTSLMEEFVDHSTIHGLQYLKAPKRNGFPGSYPERIFWLLACICAFVIGTYLIYKVIDKSITSPVLVSFDGTPVPIWEIPFPALTLCNMNKVRRSKVEKIVADLKKDPTNLYLLQEEFFIDEVCDSNTHLGEEVDTAANHDIIEQLHHGLNLSDEDVHHMLNEVAHPCDDMLVQCHFEGEERDCTEIFIPVITDDGQCCSFNVMPENVMLREKVKYASPDELKRWGNWDMQNGYHHTPNKGTPHCDGEHGAKEKEEGGSGHHRRKRSAVGSSHGTCTTEDGGPVRWDGEEMPRRAITPGLHMGLSVTLNSRVNEQFCTSFQSSGFKGLLHVPISQPEMVEYGFALSPGTENFLDLNPKTIRADDSLHKILPTIRQCFLSDERWLRFYEHYSLLNCMTECQANYTFSHCGCNMYFQPRLWNTSLCSTDQMDCFHESVKVVAEKAYAGADDHEDECQCLPSCSDYEFPTAASFSKITSAKMLHLPARIVDLHPEYSNDSYVVDNLLVLHIYFRFRLSLQFSNFDFSRHLHFMRNERDELYGFVAIVSNIGGLLGLCMGFSMLSGVELLYFAAKYVTSFFTRARPQ